VDIGSLLGRHADFRPGHTCFIFENTEFSYLEFNAYVDRLANAILSFGLQKGDKVATVLPNCIELMAAYWAAAKSGVVIVPCSPMLQGAGLVSLLNDSDATLAFIDNEHARMVDDVLVDLKHLEKDRVYIVGGTGEHSFDAFLEKASGYTPSYPPLGSNDDYNIMYTSGTTGAPKGIIHTHLIRANYGTLFAGSFRMTPESVVLHAGAIVFNGAMLDLMPWMYVGCTYILHKAFDAGAVLAAIENRKVTHMVMVPSQIITLLDHPDFDPERLGSLEMILSVGAPLMLEHKDRLNSSLPGRFYELYGLTEGFVTILDKVDSIRKAGSVGCPPAFYQMRILDKDGKQCPPGEVGEICGRGPLLMKGYYKRPDLTEQAIVDGWLHSGDLGYVDDEGYLYLVDRKKDMIISGGVNVYPKDIEEIISQHPAVREVAVFGVPHDKWGETPVAAIVLKPDSGRIAPDDIKDWANERVGAKFQRLTDILVLDDFPRNVAGKTLKRDIREAYIEGR